MTEFIKASECGSRQDVLALLKSYAVKELERELVLHKGDAAVRFMNLHKAKGLEGGIVIWVNRRKGKSFQQGRYKSDNVFYPSLEFEKNGNTVITWHACTGDVDICEKSKKENECEHIRLEYVAATRAQQALIFMEPKTEKKSEPVNEENLVYKNSDLIHLNYEFKDPKTLRQ